MITQNTRITLGISLLLSAAFMLAPNLSFAAEKAAKKKATATAPATIEPKGEAVSGDGPPLKFSAPDEPAKEGYENTIKFTDKAAGEGDSAPAQPKNDFAAPEEGFRTYLGYPKHELGLLLAGQNISSTWGFNGQEFNFSSSALLYGIGYNFIGTPSWKLGVNYSRYTVKAPEGRASSYFINSSDADLDQYGVNTEYCMISSSNFYRQYCFGGLISSDAYPVLKFIDGTHLVMSSVNDIVVGVHIGMQIPIAGKVSFKPTVGYNYGTGAGSSGTLTSDGNSKIWFRGEVPFNITQNIAVKLHGDYESRQATIKGKVGTNDDKWETDSTVFGGGADLFYQF